jgi:phage tail sheath protein FI
MMAQARIPGVYYEDVVLPRPPVFVTAVPLFLGYGGDPGGQPLVYESWEQYRQQFVPGEQTSFLAYAVRAFFDNGGQSCYVQSLDPQAPSPEQALRAGLAASEELDQIDLICAPDVLALPALTSIEPGDANRVALISSINAAAASIRAQWSILIDHCARRKDRFAVLDAATMKVAEPVDEFGAEYAATYAPWLLVPKLNSEREYVMVPPSGHVLGGYARSDHEFGIHRAPANLVLHDVVDLVDLRGGQELGEWINEIRAFRNGMRIWGTRTLSSQRDHRFVNVRRMIIMIHRWLDFFMGEVAFEPNTSSLWRRIERDVGDFLESLYESGALVGAKPNEAFFVKCNAENNSPERLAQGILTTDLGLAPARPSEFILLRVVCKGGVVQVNAIA